MSGRIKNWIETKLNVGWLVITVIAFFVVLGINLGMTLSTISNVEAKSIKNEIKIEKNSEDIQNLQVQYGDLKVLNEKIISLTKSLDGVEEQLDKFNTEVLEFYKIQRK